MMLRTVRGVVQLDRGDLLIGDDGRTRGQDKLGT